MDENPEASTGESQASAELDKIIAELGSDKAREIFELALTELITDQDPDSENPQG